MVSDPLGLQPDGLPILLPGAKAVLGGRFVVYGDRLRRRMIAALLRDAIREATYADGPLYGAGPLERLEYLAENLYPRSNPDA
jgi:hypothetical protein